MRTVNDTSERAWNADELLARLDNDRELLNELLDIFQQDFPRTRESLRVAVAAGDLKTTGFVSHTLKGMCNNLAASSAGEAASKIERLAASGNSDALPNAWQAFEQEADRLFPEIKNYAAGTQQ